MGYDDSTESPRVTGHILVIHVHRRYPLLTRERRSPHDRLIIFHSRQLEYRAAMAALKSTSLPARGTAIVTSADTSEAADSATSRDAALELLCSSTRGLTFLLFALSLSSLHLRALDALHAGMLFLLQHLAAQRLGTHVRRRALRRCGH
jgi:hypothetical protein